MAQEHYRGHTEYYAAILRHTERHARKFTREGWRHELLKEANEVVKATSGKDKEKAQQSKSESAAAPEKPKSQIEGWFQRKPAAQQKKPSQLHGWFQTKH